LDDILEEIEHPKAPTAEEAHPTTKKRVTKKKALEVLSSEEELSQPQKVPGKKRLAAVVNEAGEVLVASGVSLSFLFILF
jgi:hypothetical protein